MGATVAASASVGSHAKWHLEERPETTSADMGEGQPGADEKLKLGGGVRALLTFSIKFC